MRSAVSQVTLDAMGCSSTLATADVTYPIGAGRLGCDGVGGRTQQCECGWGGDEARDAA